KRSVNHEIPLIPFIDLLLVCVMFLLATAVWNQLAAINANQTVPGSQDQNAPPPEDKVKLILRIQDAGYVLGSTAGESTVISRKVTAGKSEYDTVELHKQLEQWKKAWEDRTDMIVAAEDGVAYDDIIRAMDVALDCGFSGLSLADGASYM